MVNYHFNIMINRPSTWSAVQRIKFTYFISGRNLYPNIRLDLRGVGNGGFLMVCVTGKVGNWLDTTSFIVQSCKLRCYLLRLVLDNTSLVSWQLKNIRFVSNNNIHSSGTKLIINIFYTIKV